MEELKSQLDRGSRAMLAGNVVKNVSIKMREEKPIISYDHKMEDKKFPLRLVWKQLRPQPLHYTCQ